VFWDARASQALRAQFGDPSTVTLKTTPVASGISIIEGANGFAGGNVGVSARPDGVFMIDDEITPMTPKLKAALGALSKSPCGSSSTPTGPLTTPAGM
jgi:hypothetical protein